MTHNNHHIFNKFIDLLNEHSNNKDREKMINILSPIARVLLQYGFDGPYKFVEIIKTFKIKNKYIRDFLKEIDNGYFENRIISKANKSEINTIMTFFAAFDKENMVSKLKPYLSEKFTDFVSIQDLFTKINNVITEIQEKVQLFSNNIGNILDQQIPADLFPLKPAEPTIPQDSTDLIILEPAGSPIPQDSTDLIISEPTGSPIPQDSTDQPPLESAYPPIRQDQPVIQTPPTSSEPMLGISVIDVNTDENSWDNPMDDSISDDYFQDPFYFLNQ